MKNTNKIKFLILTVTTLLFGFFSNIIVKGQTNQTTIIGGLEVMKDDLGYLTFNEANFACKDLRFGWRLPTKDELNVVYKNKNKIGGFGSAGSYWSSTLSNISLNKVWYQEFEFGMQSLDERGERHRTVAVRNVQENQTKNDIKSPRKYDLTSNPQYEIFYKLKKSSQLPSKIKRKSGKPARVIETIGG